MMWRIPLLGLTGLLIASAIGGTETRTKIEGTAEQPTGIVNVRDEESLFVLKHDGEALTFGERFSLSDRVKGTLLGTTDNAGKVRLEGDVNNDVTLGVLYGKTSEEEISSVYGRFERNGHVVGLGYSDVSGEQRVNFFGVYDWKHAPLVQELLLSGGTSGLGTDDYFVSFRVPSTKQRDFGYEAFTIFDHTGVQRYLFRFAAGNARMGAAGHYGHAAGTGQRVADIDGSRSLINEVDLTFPLPYELWERGEYGIQITGSDQPNVELTWNPRTNGHWVGIQHDFASDTSSVEGGLNLGALLRFEKTKLNLKLVTDFDDYTIRLEHKVTF